MSKKFSPRYCKENMLRRPRTQPIRCHFHLSHGERCRLVSQVADGRFCAHGSVVMQKTHLRKAKQSWGPGSKAYCGARPGHAGQITSPVHLRFSVYTTPLFIPGRIARGHGGIRCVSVSANTPDFPLLVTPTLPASRATSPLIARDSSPSSPPPWPVSAVRVSSILASVPVSPSVSSSPGITATGIRTPP